MKKMRYKVLFLGIGLFLSSSVFALDSSHILFYLPLNKGLKAEISHGASEPLPGIKPEYTKGINGKGSAVIIGKSAWLNASPLPILKMPRDVGLWRYYGSKDTVGPLRYPAKGNIRAESGTFSFWYKPLGWNIPNSRDHFMVNLGMKNSLALIYATYFGVLSFQNSIIIPGGKGSSIQNGETQNGTDPFIHHVNYRRCIGEWPWPEKKGVAGYKNTWVNITVSWRKDLMETWLNGQPWNKVRANIIPMKDASGNIILGSGDSKEAAFGDVLVLGNSISTAEAEAIYKRDVPVKGDNFLSIPSITAPVINGKFIPEQWKDATSLTGWADRILGVANKDKTSIKVGYDKNNLYVLFLYPIPKKFLANRTLYVGSPLKITTTKPDGNVFNDDYVGIYLSPAGSNDIYFFGVNGANAKLDEKNGNASWNGNWTVRQSYNDKYWIVEFAIPFSNFGKGPEGTWGINFAHGIKQLADMDGIWTYQPAKETPLSSAIFSEQKVAANITSIGDLNDGILSLKGNITNNGEKPFKGTSEIQIKEDKKILFGPEKTDLIIQPGKEKQFTGNFDISKAYYGGLIINVKSNKGNTLLSYRLPFVYSRKFNTQSEYMPTPEILREIVDLGSSSTLKKTSGGKIEVLSLNNKILLTKKIKRFNQIREGFDFNTKNLPAGKYEVLTKVQIGGTFLSEKNSFEKKSSPVWLNNRLGYTNGKVPKPWTALKLRGRKVSCLLRQYTFGSAAGLPSQINILGKNILAGPVRIIIKTGGKTIIVTHGSFSVTKTKETHISFTSSSTVGNLDITGHDWIEFDGFVWNRIKISPSLTSSSKIDSLVIEFPIKKKYATLWWPANYVRILNLHSPAKPNFSDPVNDMRIGSPDRGIQFYWQDLRNWHFVHGKGEELIPGKNTYIVRYNLLSYPTKITKPLEFSFGYMALPSRPLTSYYRMIDTDAVWSNIVPSGPGGKAFLAKTHQLFAVNGLFGWGWDRHLNYFNIWNPKVYGPNFRKQLKTGIQNNWKENRGVQSLYICMNLTDSNTPEYRYYRFEWQTVPGSAIYSPSNPKTRNSVDFATINVGSKSYDDYYMYYLNKTVRYLTNNGKIPIVVYIDNSGVSFTNNTYAGAPKSGYIPYLARREYMKRMYVILKSINPLNQIYVHCSGEDNMSAWTYADWMIEGEQMVSFYEAKLANNPSLPKNYTRLLSLSEIRAQFQPYAWGPARMFLYEFWNWNKTQPYRNKPARAHLWGLMMVNDASVWGGGSVANIIQAIEDFGWASKKVQFIPYWRKNNGIEVSSSVQPVVASAWKRGKGNLLVMVLNNSHKTATGKLKIDFNRFGFTTGQINLSNYGYGGLAYPKRSFNPQPVKKTVISNTGIVKFNLGQHSYKLLRFYQED